MGLVHSFICKNCHYVFEATLGTGMFYRKTYNRIVEEIKQGKHGEEYKKIFEEHPLAAVNCELFAAVCTQCKKLDTVEHLGLYLPNYENGDCPDAGNDPRVLSWAFHKCMDYNHKCSCGGEMKIIDDIFTMVDNGTLKCPNCDGKMEWTRESFFWD